MALLHDQKEVPTALEIDRSQSSCRLGAAGTPSVGTK